jgi:hypothetical protein
MMTKQEMHDDERIYKDLRKAVLSKEDLERVRQMIRAWAIAAEELPDEARTVRIMFFACVQLIRTMGPAYCRIAELNLRRHAARGMQ